MALTATIHTFDIALADSDRHVYESLTLRVARHPSESEEYLLTRVQTRPMMPKIAVRQVSNELLFDAVRREARQKGLGDDHAGPPGAGAEQ